MVVGDICWMCFVEWLEIVTGVDMKIFRKDISSVCSRLLIF